MKKQKPAAACFENPAIDLHVLLGPERAYFGGFYDENIAFEPAGVETGLFLAALSALLRRMRELRRRFLGLLFTAKRPKVRYRHKQAVSFGACP